MVRARLGGLCAEVKANLTSPQADLWLELIIRYFSI